MANISTPADNCNEVFAATYVLVFGFGAVASIVAYTFAVRSRPFVIVILLVA